MKQLTLLQFFDQYPVTTAGLAKRLGKSREWLSALAHNRLNLTTEVKAKHYLTLNTELKQLSSELQDILIK